MATNDQDYRSGMQQGTQPGYASAGRRLEHMTEDDLRRIVRDELQPKPKQTQHETCEHKSGCWAHELNGYLVLRCLICREPVSVSGKIDQGTASQEGA